MKLTIKITEHEEGYTAKVVAADALLSEFNGAEGYAETIAGAIKKMAARSALDESPSFWNEKLAKWNKNVADWTKANATAHVGFTTI